MFLKNWDMKLSYKKIGPYIGIVDDRNIGDKKNNLFGVSVQKYFIKSIANTIGTDFTRYRIVRKNQFTYIPDTSRRGDKIGIALFDFQDEGLVSQAYTVFQITDPNILLPEYLMMWFRRPEFDRYARFMSHGSVREIFSWEEMCNVSLPIPSIDRQREIVKEYTTIVDKIDNNRKLNEKLEESIRFIYKSNFSNSNSDNSSMSRVLDEYVEINPKVSVTQNTIIPYVELNDLSTTTLSIAGYVKRRVTSGTRFQSNDTLLARITPSLENGKTGFVDFLDKNESAIGSTEFIVLRPRAKISPYWVYCLARDEHFRKYAISSMVGSSGRQRVHEKYLKVYPMPVIEANLMNEFHSTANAIFDTIKLKSDENKYLSDLKDLLLAKISAGVN